MTENCFNHCHKKGVKVRESERSTKTEETLSSMKGEATESGVQLPRVCLDDLLCSPDVDDATESSTLQSAANRIVGIAD